jgi:hypothetical protein
MGGSYVLRGTKTLPGRYATDPPHAPARARGEETLCLIAIQNETFVFTLPLGGSSAARGGLFLFGSLELSRALGALRENVR